jgi:CBS domain-containing protein
MMTHRDVRRCTVYERDGKSQSSYESRSATRSPRQRTIADRVSLHDVMSNELVCARPELEIATVVSLMIRHHVGCIPVVDGRRHPVGMITKFDLLENLDATMQSNGNGSPMPADLAARTADEVMMPLALVLDEQATIAHAAAMMALEDTHHVLVVRDTGELLGVVSSKDIVGWLVSNDGLATTS